MKRIISTLILSFMLFSIAPAFSMAAEKKSTLSEKQVKALIATAKRPADHRSIAAYYRQEARNLANKAKEHDEMAAMYQKNPLPYEGKFAYGTVGSSHCKRFAELFYEQIKEAEALASLHEEMAKAAEQK